MNNDPVLALLKLGEPQFIDSFLSGQLYMNSLSYFADIEEEQARSDAREGQAFWIQTKNLKLSVKVDGQYKEIPELCGPMAYTNPKDLATNVFCMHALRAGRIDRGQPVEQRNLEEFGACFALVLFGDEFLNRVKAASDTNGVVLNWGLVEYIDKLKYQGPVGIFRKTAEFAYQSEFRFAIQPGTGTPYKLHVGNLRDIAISGPTNELNRILKIELIEGRPRLFCATNYYKALAARRF